MLELATRAEEHIRSLRGQIGGRVMIGCTPAGAEALLSQILKAFHERHPAVSLAVSVALPEILLDRLARQHIHIALIEEKQSPRSWIVQLLGSEPLELIAPRTHEITHRGLITPDALRHLPLIMPLNGSAARRLIEERLRSGKPARIDINIVLETDSVTAAIEAVRNGLGMAFVPRSCLTHHSDVSIVPVDGLNLQQEWFALRAREQTTSRAVQEAFAFLTGPDVRTILHHAGIQSPLETKTRDKIAKTERRRS
jgi:DNA-binding transcriptional LysR family regulator